jgi:hypothetical protein
MVQAVRVGGDACVLGVLGSESASAVLEVFCGGPRESLSCFFCFTGVANYPL